MEEGMPVHRFWLRMLHLVNAATCIMMIMSGLEIYNAAPIYDFTFPKGLTLGGDLTQAVRWHLAMAWIYLLTSTAFAVFRLCLQSGGPHLRGITRRELKNSVVQLLKLSLRYSSNQYNAIQKVTYCTIIGVAFVSIASGLAIWKPVQLQFITSLMGGYEVSREIHFICMAAFSSFIVIHLVMVAIHPSTLLSIVFGKPAEGVNDSSS